MKPVREVLETLSPFLDSYARDLRLADNADVPSADGDVGRDSAASGSDTSDSRPETSSAKSDLNDVRAEMVGHLAPQRRMDRRRLPRGPLPPGRQLGLESLSELIQSAVATIGEFDPARLVTVTALAADPGLSELVASRLSTLCTERIGGKGERWWFMRAAPRRLRLVEIARTRSKIRLDLIAEWTLWIADRRDPFTRSLQAAIAGRSVNALLIRPADRSAALAAMEFAAGAFEQAPDPSALRLRLVRNGIRTRLSSVANPASRLLAFRGFLRAAVKDSPPVLVLRGSDAAERSARLLNLRSALFTDRRRSVLMLDFRRPALAEPAYLAIAAEVALQLLQQEKGRDFSPSPDTWDAEHAIRDACSRNTEVVALCDAFDSVEDGARLYRILTEVSRADPGTPWRFVLSVSAGWSPPDGVVATQEVDLDAPGFARTLMAQVAATSALVAAVGRRR